MKTKMIYWVMLTITMLAMSACNNDDFSDILKERNLMTENIEVFEVGREGNNVIRTDINPHCDKSLHYCFEKREELDGLYAIDDTKLSNWNNRTLVMVHATYHGYMGDFTIKVYEKKGKYVIELLEKEGWDFRECAFDHHCYGILLDKANINPKDIQIKVGIFHSKGEDEEGNWIDAYYEYI